MANQLREFTAEEIGAMTVQFSEVVGRGPFGCVYKGTLGHTAVAVKVIDPVRNIFPLQSSHHSLVHSQKALQDIGQATFMTELNALTRYMHV